MPQFRRHHNLMLGRCLDDGDVERGCLQTDGDDPARYWPAAHDCVRNLLVDKEPHALLVFISFTTVVELVSLVC